MISSIAVYVMIIKTNEIRCIIQNFPNTLVYQHRHRTNDGHDIRHMADDGHASGGHETGKNIFGEVWFRISCSGRMYSSCKFCSGLHVSLWSTNDQHHRTVRQELHFQMVLVLVSRHSLGWANDKCVEENRAGKNCYQILGKFSRRQPQRHSGNVKKGKYHFFATYQGTIIAQTSIQKVDSSHVLVVIVNNVGLENGHKGLLWLRESPLV